MVVVSNETLVIHVEPLKQFVTSLFSKAGMSSVDARFYAHSLVQTNLWGIDSHGVLRAPIYVKRLLSGAMNPKPNIKKISGSAAIEVLEGDNGPGFIVGRDAMKRAIELAEKYNISAVGAVRSNHFGAAAIYARMAAENGMIGIVMTNVVPNVVAPGGSKPITGNNPLAIAIPTFGEFPFVLDISMSNVSGGKLLLASKKGEKIPFDWATDADGRPTDDPDTGFKGFLLPTGAYKGLGLSYAIDILSGVITGGAFQHAMKGMYKYPDDPSLTCHFMMVINPLILMDKEELKERMGQFYQGIKASPMWDENREMMLPGEIEYRSEQKRLKEGIPVPPNLVDDLIALSEKLGVEHPFNS
jgi:L-2-hydroxycarboxylate dehydrogenase (NAD+)